MHSSTVTMTCTPKSAPPAIVCSLSVHLSAGVSEGSPWFTYLAQTDNTGVDLLAAVGVLQRHLPEEEVDIPVKLERSHELRFCDNEWEREEILILPQTHEPGFCDSEREGRENFNTVIVLGGSGTKFLWQRVIGVEKRRQGERDRRSKILV